MTVHEHPLRIQLDTDAAVFQAFLLGAKKIWGTSLYHDVAREADELSDSVTDPGELHERLIGGSATYQVFAWAEHYLQQFKYAGRYGLVPRYEDSAKDVARELDAAQTQGPGGLRLDPDLPLPDYYTKTDFHQHPGGIWSDDIDACAYEYGARTPFSVSLASETELHDRLSEIIAGYEPHDILDLGCGFGKSTFSLKRRLPDSDVVGIDLSRPALRLAHLRGVESSLDVEFLQQNAERTTLADSSFDVVTGTMFIHELPTEANRRVFREARRLLRPSGRLIFLDFYLVPGGTAGMMFHLGQSDRNNEPFMRDLVGLDLEHELLDAGFSRVELAPFEEEDGALANGDRLPSTWRFPWTTITAEV